MALDCESVIRPNPADPKSDEQKNAPELPIGRFLKSESLGGNRVILIVMRHGDYDGCPRSMVTLHTRRKG
jgi:hypothetical protein